MCVCLCVHSLWMFESERRIHVKEIPHSLTVNLRRVGHAKEKKRCTLCLLKITFIFNQNYGKMLVGMSERYKSPENDEHMFRLHPKWKHISERNKSRKRERESFNIKRKILHSTASLSFFIHMSQCRHFGFSVNLLCNNVFTVSWLQSSHLSRHGHKRPWAVTGYVTEYIGANVQTLKKNPFSTHSELLFPLCDQ